MEFLIILAVVIALLIMIGVEIPTILMGFMGLLGLIILLILVFFIYCLTKLVGAKKCRGVLSKVDKSPKFEYNCAYYEVDGVEYANIFPCEVVLKKHLYTQGKEYVLRLNKKKETVFDPNAYACLIFGLILSTASLIWIAGIFKSTFLG